MNQATFSFLYNFAHQSTGLDAAITFIARDFIWVIFIALFFFLFKNKDKKIAVRDVVIVFGAAAVGAVLATILKNIFQTLRPFDALTTVRALIEESGFAFPSGHTMVLAGMAGALWSEYQKPAFWVGITAILVGSARVAAGVHWPIDILGGLVVGLVLGYSVFIVGKRVLQNSKKSLY